MPVANSGRAAGSGVGSIVPVVPPNPQDTPVAHFEIASLWKLQLTIVPPVNPVRSTVCVASNDGVKIRSTEGSGVPVSTSNSQFEGADAIESAILVNSPAPTKRSAEVIVPPTASTFMVPVRELVPKSGVAPLITNVLAFAEGERDSEARANRIVKSANFSVIPSALWVELDFANM
jgi:hypothetical protein